MLKESHFNEMLSLIRRVNAKRVFVQVPEGLKPEIGTLSGFLTRNMIECIFSCEPCFGACDLKWHEAKILGCDVLLHIGHADFGVKSEIPVVYYELKLKYDFSGLIERNIEKLSRFKKIGLITTIQYADEVPSVKNTLERCGKAVFTAKNARSGIRGHILGCDYSAIKSIEEKIDCIIYFGSGVFHPFGLDTDKPVFSADCERGSLIEVTDEIRKNTIKRELSIEKARGLKNFAVYVSTKPGQMHSDEALNAKTELEKRGKTAIILSADAISPEKLCGIKIDAIVNTGCPRIANDASAFGKPIINYEDVKRL